MDGDGWVSAAEGPERDKPKIDPLHRIRHNRSILAVAVSEEYLFGGTEGGEILKWCLKTYELAGQVVGHAGAVLSLFYSEKKEFLLSSAGDALVNVWCTDTLRCLYSVCSTYDVGDVFCVVYSTFSQAVFLGAQNTSIQWCKLDESFAHESNGRTSRPPHRSHRFFDSKGRDGKLTRTPSERHPNIDVLGGGHCLEIDNENIIQYAHNGYIYCMLLAGRDHGSAHVDTLISGGGDGQLKIWEYNPKSAGVLSAVATLDNGDNSVMSMALDGAILYGGLLGGEVNVWDVETKQLVRNVKAHTLDVLTLSVTGELILSGAGCGAVKVFNRRNECVRTWQAHTGLVLASALKNFEDRSIYVTGGNDNCVAVWDISEWTATASSGSPTSNDQMLESLAKLVAFPTVSSNTGYAEDCHRGAEFLQTLFKRFGADSRVLSTPEKVSPVVLAQFKHSHSLLRKSKRILFYGHYDVVPADNNRGQWATDPFRLEGVNGYLYGRGVSDNKGPVIAALYAAAELAAAQQLGPDVIFLIEGDEECGSRGFQQTVERNKDLIGQVDWIIVANSYWLNDDVPCLTYGLRGVIHAKVSIQSHDADLHSGVHGSSLRDEPLKDLVRLTSGLLGHQGMIQLPGFYDPIPAPTAAEAVRYAAISRVLLAQDPTLATEVDELTMTLMRRWREPSLTLHRFNVSGPEDGSVIPRSAEAVLSIRLVPNQAMSRVRACLVDFLQGRFRQLESRNELFIYIGHQADPWLGDPDNDLFRTLEKAIMEVWNRAEQPRPSSARGTTLTTTAATTNQSTTSQPFSEATNHHRQSTPLYIREGGSIPAIRFLERTFDAPAANLPCGQASDNAHLDRERLRMVNLYNSRDIFRKVFG